MHAETLLQDFVDQAYLLEILSLERQARFTRPPASITDVAKAAVTAVGESESVVTEEATLEETLAATDLGVVAAAYGADALTEEQLREATSAGPATKVFVCVHGLTEPPPMRWGTWSLRAAILRDGSRVRNLTSRTIWFAASVLCFVCDARIRLLGPQTHHTSPGTSESTHQASPESRHQASPGTLEPTHQTSSESTHQTSSASTHQASPGTPSGKEPVVQVPQMSSHAGQTPQSVEGSDEQEQRSESPEGAVEHEQTHESTEGTAEREETTESPEGAVEHEQTHESTERTAEREKTTKSPERAVGHEQTHESPEGRLTAGGPAVQIHRTSTPCDEALFELSRAVAGIQARLASIEDVLASLSPKSLPSPLRAGRATVVLTPTASAPAAKAAHEGQQQSTLENFFPPRNELR